MNGNITMTGGKIIVHGPTSSANGALDYDLSYKMNGGLLAVAGSSAMAQAPGTNSSQYSLLINFRSINNAATVFHIQNSSGANVLTFEPQKRYNSVAFSSSLLTKGETFTVYTGGSSTGSPNLGYYEDGSYIAGTQVTTFTVSSTVTKITIYATIFILYLLERSYV